MADAATHDANGAAADTESVNYDLTMKMARYLDRHLIFPLLDFLAQEEIYPTADIAKARYNIVAGSQMADYATQLHKELYPDQEVPEIFAKRRQEFEAAYKVNEESSRKVLEILQDDEVRAALRQDKAQNLAYLKDQKGVSIENINAVYHFGKSEYVEGNYTAAADILYHFKILSTDNEMTAWATWGKFAAEILSYNWGDAIEEMQSLRDIIDQRVFVDPSIQLLHRTWLIHWSLYPFFNHENGRELLIDLFFNPAYINTIQQACPWILRYLIACVITSRQRKTNPGQHAKQMRDIVRIVKQEAYQYEDPLTKFITALYVDFDFAEAQRYLILAEEVFRSDFFLVSIAGEFIDASRHLVSEAYCRIHQRIDMKDLSNRLNLPNEEGEKWIVDLIRDSRMDAKIDHQEGTVITNHSFPSVYQQVIERTKNLYMDLNVVLNTSSGHTRGVA